MATTTRHSHVVSPQTCLTDGAGASDLWFLSDGVGWAMADDDLGQSGCPELIGTTDAGLHWEPLTTPFATVGNA